MRDYKRDGSLNLDASTRQEKEVQEEGGKKQGCVLFAYKLLRINNKHQLVLRNGPMIVKAGLRRGR